MDSNINIIFGKLVSTRRRALSLSQEELGNRCDLHRTYIGAIERGEKSPTLSTIEKISKGQDIPIYKLWEDLKTD